MVGDCSASGMAPASVEARRLASIWSYLACASSVSARAAASRWLLAESCWSLIRRVLGADEIVLRLVDRERVLGVAKPFLQFLEPAGQIGGRPPRGGGLRLLGFRQIGVGDRVGEHRRLRRVIRPDVDVDDEGAIGLLDVDVANQGFQRRHLAELGFVGGPGLDPEQAEQRADQCPWRRRRTPDPCRGWCPGSPAAARCSR